MHDLVIRGGTIVDGSGAPPFTGDIAIDGDRIVAVGTVTAKGHDEIDATGHIVTPGFVDIHTHYDGQATWDPELGPSSWHGVTSIVMGNCGVGFAPARPDKHDWLIGLMEGVEDIPGTALAEGMTWGWESFPEYLDALEAMPRTIDIATQVPHGAVRAYVMGDRGAANEPATAADIAAMARIVEDGLRAGALGFTTSRTVLHRAVDGNVVPGTYADRAELLGIGDGIARAGHGVFEMASDLNPCGEEFAWMKDLSIATGMPVSFALLQSPLDDEGWRDQLARTDAANAEGARVTAQIALRGTGVLLNWRGTAHPFITRASWVRIAALPWDEQLAHLRDPAFKTQLLADPADRPEHDGPLVDLLFHGWTLQFPLGDEPDYEPTPDMSIAAIAAREGRSPEDVAYDLMLADDGRGFIYLPILNYADGHLDHVLELLDHPATVVSLSDGGAHCGVICDAASPTFMLTHWARDRKRAGKLSIAAAVKHQTADTAAMYGLGDRGRLAPGLLADINIIDFDRLKLAKPYIAFDLPAGGKRLLQRASGYAWTIKSGVVTFRDGVATGARPGKLVRGPRGATLAGQLATA
ncbi:MAG: amidohydrolase family protein [Sphingomonadaceae bacterium]|nr:amidohydrolase family protein [Sphingomonadaceae bacterium]